MTALIYRHKDVCVSVYVYVCVNCYHLSMERVISPAPSNVRTSSFTCVWVCVCVYMSVSVFVCLQLCACKHWSVCSYVCSRVVLCAPNMLHISSKPAVAATPYTPTPTPTPTRPNTHIPTHPRIYPSCISLYPPHFALCTPYHATNQTNYSHSQ